MGQEKLILGHTKMKYGTEQGDFLGQEKLTYGHNKTNFGTEEGDFFTFPVRESLTHSITYINTTTDTTFYIGIKTKIVEKWPN